MTTPTTTPTPAQQQAEQFRAEIKRQFAEMEKNLLFQNQVIETVNNSIDLLHVEIAELRADLAQMREGLTHASQPAPASGQTETMQATRITKTRTAGKDYYKILGGRYTKRGVTIWIEGLKALDLDPKQIEWDETDGYTFPTPLNVTVLMKEYKDEETGETKTTPQKVIGRA